MNNELEELGNMNLVNAFLIVSVIANLFS